MPSRTDKAIQAADWSKRARQLAWFTVIYNVLEALACGFFGVKDGGYSLLGFGGDSLIEAASAAVVIWHFRKSSRASESSAHRLISVLLIALSSFLAVSSFFEIRKGEGPRSGSAGIVIALVSLAVMFWLYRQKMACAKALDSAALRADAFCTLSCMWLSGLLLAGSAAFAWTGIFWFDAVTTLGMAFLIAREGLEEYDESRGHGHGHSEQHSH